MNLENEIVRLVHMHQTEYWSDLEEMDIHGEPLELPEMKHILIQYVNHEKIRCTSTLRPKMHASEKDMSVNSTISI